MDVGLIILLVGALVIVGLVLAVVGIVGMTRKQRLAWVWLVVGLVVAFVPIAGGILWTVIVLMCTGHDGSWIC